MNLPALFDAIAAAQLLHPAELADREAATMLHGRTLHMCAFCADTAAVVITIEWSDLHGAPKWLDVCALHCAELRQLATTGIDDAQIVTAWEAWERDRAGHRG